MTAVLPEHADPIAELRGILRTIRPDADLARIRHAYDVAAYWHHGQLRRSGDPYVTHPLAVATILARLGADDQTLCAALLHDTLEDTSYTPAALSREFGAEVAAMVAELTALDRIRARDLAQVMAAINAADTRVVAMKVADRLHNMRTLQFLTQPGQAPKALLLNQAVPTLRCLLTDYNASLMARPQCPLRVRPSSPRLDPRSRAGQTRSGDGDG